MTARRTTRQRTAILRSWANTTKIPDMKNLPSGWGRPNSHSWIALASFLLLAGCSDYAALPSRASESTSTLAPCPDTADTFAAWQCQRFYAKQWINGRCLTATGGEGGIKQCQQFYAKLAEMPAPSSTSGRPVESSPSPSSSPSVTTPRSPGIAVGKFAGREAIYVGGTITPDENEDFVRYASALHNPLVVLSGPGGATMAAVRIGQFVRMRGWDTLVPEGEPCMSACALAWLGGAHRYMGTTSKIGFHASYRMEGGKAVESGVGNAVVGAYLARLGLPERAVMYVTMAGPDDIQLLTLRDANARGIQVATLGLNSLPD